MTDMDSSLFFNLLTEEVIQYSSILETDDHEWIVKGFIDVNKRIYTITKDTKVVSKLIEIILIPHLAEFAAKNGLELVLPSKQNYYPDLTFVDSENHKYAVDFKTSYYEGDTVNGLTLGSYWGYFRERDSKKSMDFPYSDYCCHLVLGILYKQNPDTFGEKLTFNIDEFEGISSVIKDFKFFLQPKWKIASDHPGSGNTRNIGGITNVNDIINGKGVFTQFKDGESVFDDYWTNYFSNQDAEHKGLGAPKYNNIDTYREYLRGKESLLKKIEG